jgi:hypothetical protein
MEKVISIDSLYTKTNQFIVALDSRNATTYLNGSKNSQVSFELEEPIYFPRDALALTCNVHSFISPNSLFNINSTNNFLHFIYQTSSISLSLPAGNYNSTTFMSALVSAISNVDKLFIIGFSISLNPLNNCFTFSHTTYNIQIQIDTTMWNILGLAQGSLLGQITQTGTGPFNLVLPYTCNFTGLQSFNIRMESMNTDNIDSLTKSTSNIVQNVHVYANQSQIVYKSHNNFSFNVKEKTIDLINVSLEDDLSQFLDLNNQHWNITLCFSLTFDIDRFSHENNFHKIISEGYK